MDYPDSTFVYDTVIYAANVSQSQRSILRARFCPTVGRWLVARQPQPVESGAYTHGAATNQKLLKYLQELATRCMALAEHNPVHASFDTSQGIKRCQRVVKCTFKISKAIKAS